MTLHCPHCGGEGRYEAYDGWVRTGSGYGDAAETWVMTTCLACDGDGRARCEACGELATGIDVHGLLACGPCEVAERALLERGKDRADGEATVGSVPRAQS